MNDSSHTAAPAPAKATQQAQIQPKAYIEWTKDEEERMAAETQSLLAKLRVISAQNNAGGRPMMKKLTKEHIDTFSARYANGVCPVKYVLNYLEAEVGEHRKRLDKLVELKAPDVLLYNEAQFLNPERIPVAGKPQLEIWNRWKERWLTSMELDTAKPWQVRIKAQERDVYDLDGHKESEVRVYPETLTFCPTGRWGAYLKEL